MKQIELNIRGNVVSVSRYVRYLCKRCTTSISPSLKLRVGQGMWIFVFFALRFSIRSIRLFLVFDLIFDLIPDSASKNVKAMVSMILR